MVEENVLVNQTVYSDRTLHANYYKWNDGAHDEYGYFVSFVDYTSEVAICSGGDIFGVTVESAAFVGNQDPEFPRDNTYALVATQGIVEVRCESDINGGDCVVSNAYGIATKTTSECGYKVIAVDTKYGTDYATITLGVQACTTDLIGKRLDNLEANLDDAHTNIAAAMNVANEAYNKAQESSTVSEDALKQALDAALKADDAVDATDEMNNTISSVSVVATQAKAIAESAATSAESMKTEAVEKANEALAEAVQTREDVEQTITEMETDLDNAALELQATKEELANTANQLQSNINNAVSDIEDLTEEMEPLASWPDAENPTGVVGFVARANEDSATLAGIVTWQGETNTAIAGFKQEVAETYATIKSVTSYQTETSKAIASVEEKTDANAASIISLTNKDTELTQSLAKTEQKATDNVASINSLTSWKTEVESDVESIASIKQQSDANKASIESITSWQDSTTESINTISQKADVNESNIAILASWQSDVESDVSSIASIKTTADANKAAIEELVKKDSELSTTIAGVKTTADTNAASIESITAWQSNVDPTISSVASIQQQANDNEAAITGLTSWQGKTNTTLTSIKQKSDANGASIALMVANIDKYSVGPYSHANGFTLEQAKDVLEKGMIYVPTASHSGESFNTDYAFTKTNIYTWSGETWTEDVGQVVFSGTMPSGSTYLLWYTDSDTVTEGYEPYTLYKYGTYETVDDDGNATTESHWEPVATLKGSSQSRAVSQIRQEANSIEIAITDLDNNYAGVKADLSDTQSTVQQLSKWANNGATIKTEANEVGSAVTIQSYTEDSEGTITEQASLVLNVVKDANGNPTSALSVDADYINFEGFTTFVRPGDLSGVNTTTINGSNITTGIIQSNGYTDNNETVYSDAGMSINLDNGVITSKQFAIDSGGKFYTTGGEIGKWKITASGLSYGTWNTDGSFILWPEGFSTSFGSFGSQDWVMTSGTTFGVTSSGALYANDAYITGNITANSGKIGGFDIDSTKMEKVNSTTYDGGIKMRQTTTIQPNSVLVKNETYEYSECILERSVSIANGILQTTLNASELPSGGLYEVMRATIQDTTYKIYIDNSTMTLKVSTS